jgi:hypothetical protein
MMETVCTSKTSVHFNVTTRRYIPEDSELHIRTHENLKSHKWLGRLQIFKTHINTHDGGGDEAAIPPYLRPALVQSSVLLQVNTRSKVRTIAIMEQRAFIPPLTWPSPIRNLTSVWLSVWWITYSALILSSVAHSLDGRVTALWDNVILLVSAQPTRDMACWLSFCTFYYNLAKKVLTAEAFPTLECGCYLEYYAVSSVR